MSNLNRSAFQGHPFHLVSPSPWPIFTCISLLTLTTSGVLTIHGFSSAGNWLLCAFALLVSSMFFWFKDIISEGTYLGNHTLAVQRGLNIVVGVFLVFQVLFAFSYLAPYCYSALGFTTGVVTQWPPMGMEAINAFELPLLKIVILLALGVTVLHSYHSLVLGNRKTSVIGIILNVKLFTIFLTGIPLLNTLIFLYTVIFFTLLLANISYVSASKYTM